MEEIILSIIIPVYKAENYIRKCLDSVVNQTGSHYEVVVIDDGSPDHSGEICDEYAVKYPQVKVFHQKNIGVTRTREVGIEKAQGKYIAWVDADDTADPDLVKDVSAAFEKSHADIVIYGAEYHEKGKTSEVLLPHKEPLEAMRRKSVTGEYSTLWSFAVPRTFWLGEHAPKEMGRSAADGYMAIRMFMKAKCIEIIQKPLYYHLVDNPNSIRHTFNGMRYMGNFYLWYYRLHICETKFKDMCRHCASRAYSGAVKAYSMSLIMNDLPKEYQEELIEAIRYLRKYPINGRWRDRFLGWCILHRMEGPCKRYARHKMEKTKRQNAAITHSMVQ